MRVASLILSCVFLLVLVFGVNANAKDGAMSKEDWEELVGTLPDTAAELIGDEALESCNSFGEAVKELSSPQAVVKRILEICGVQLEEAVKLFCILCALLVICSAFNTTSESISNGLLSSAVRFCTSGSIFAAVVYTLYTQFENVESFFSTLGGLMRGMIPACASIWAMGGNISTASTGSATLYVILVVCEELFGKSVIPVCCLMSVLGLCDAMSGEMKTGRMMSAIKKIYNFLLCAVMALLLSSLSAQNVICAAADSAAARTAKFLSGSVIPVIGGSVGETLRTVMGSVSYLKSVFGVGGIIMIMILVLPVLISVLMVRGVFLLCAGLADMLGCPNEAKLLENLSEVYGTMLAVICVVAVTFILSLCVFIQTVIAVTS